MRKKIGWGVEEKGYIFLLFSRFSLTGKKEKESLKKTIMPILEKSMIIQAMQKYKKFCLRTDLQVLTGKPKSRPPAFTIDNLEYRLAFTIL